MKAELGIVTVILNLESENSGEGVVGDKPAALLLYMYNTQLAKMSPSGLRC